MLHLEAEGVVAPTRTVFRHKDKRLKTIQENFCNSKHSLYLVIDSLVSWPPPFFVLLFAFSIKHRNRRAARSEKVWNTCHMNDIRWT